MIKQPNPRTRAEGGVTTRIRYGDLRSLSAVWTPLALSVLFFGIYIVAEKIATATSVHLLNQCSAVSAPTRHGRAGASKEVVPFVGPVDPLEYTRYS